MFTLFIILAIVGIGALIVFGIGMKLKSIDPILVVLASVVVAVSFFGSGVSFSDFHRGQLLPGRVISDNKLYLVGTTTNVICLIPARLNGLTAIVEPDGSPRYYGAVEMEANQGPVIAVKAKDGEIVLKSFPLKEVEK